MKEKVQVQCPPLGHTCAHSLIEQQLEEKAPLFTSLIGSRNAYDNALTYYSSELRQHLVWDVLKWLLDSMHALYNYVS